MIYNNNMSCHNLSEYLDFKKASESKEYCLSKNIIYKKQGKFVVFKYNKKNINSENVTTLGLFRSVIYDTQADRIVCYSPPKSHSMEEFTSNNSPTDCTFKEFVEGTMINVFYDNSDSEWRITTKTMIGASFKYFQDADKSFSEMFYEAVESYPNFSINDLNKEYCYSFVLQHPDNRIVVPLSEKSLYCIAVYKCLYDDENNHHVVMNETNDMLKTIQCSKPLNFSEVANFDDKFAVWDYAKYYFLNNILDYKIKGIVISSKMDNGNRFKIVNPTYNDVKSLRGNSTKLQFQYLSLRQSGKVKDYLKYFPESKTKFMTFRDSLHKWTNDLYNLYIICFIHKKKHVNDCPYQYRPHLMALHKMYLSSLSGEKIKINFARVVKYANSLEPARLMYSLNYNLRKIKVEEIKNQHEMLKSSM